MPPPPRCVSVFSDDDSSDEASQIPTPPSTSEDSCGPKARGASNSQLPRPHPSYAASTLQIQVETLQKVLQHTPRPTPKRRQQILERLLGNIYDCYLTLKDVHRALRWSDLSSGSLKSLKALLQECCRSPTASLKQIRLAESIAAEEGQSRPVGLQAFSGAGTMRQNVEEEAHVSHFGAETGTSASNCVSGLEVTNLSSAINARRLRREFERFGSITNCSVLYSSEPGRPEAVGRIEFATSEDAAKAKAEMHHHVLDGYLLNVDFDAPRDYLGQNPSSAKDSTASATDQASRRHVMPPAPRGGLPEESGTEIPRSNHQTPLEQIFPDGSPQLATFEQIRNQLLGVQISDSNDPELHDGNVEDVAGETSSSADKLHDHSLEAAHSLLDEDAADIQALITSLENEIGKLDPSRPNFASRSRTLSEQYDMACDRYVEITDREPETKWTVPKFGKAGIAGMQFKTSSDKLRAYRRMAERLRGNGGASNVFPADVPESLSILENANGSWHNDSPFPISKKEGGAAQEALPSAEDVAIESTQWSAEQDEELAFFKAHCPAEPWTSITEAMGKTGPECKERCMTLKHDHALPGLSEKQKTLLAAKHDLNANDSKQPTAKGMKLTKKERKLLKQKESTAQKATAPGQGIDAAADPFPRNDPWGDIDDSIGCPETPIAHQKNNSSGVGIVCPRECFRGPNSSQGQARSVQSAGLGGWRSASTRGDHEWMDTHAAADDAATCWGFEAKAVEDGDSGWGSLDQEDARDTRVDRNDKSVPKPATRAPKPYIITYWATVECDGQEAHIPIDSNNVSGPEKAVLDGPAKTVWKWAQEKGLCDKIGLQDAFDLAKEMTTEAEAVEKAEENAEGKWQAHTGYTSRTVSPSAPPRSSAGWPSPLSEVAWARRASHSLPLRRWGRSASPTPAPSLRGVSGGGSGDLENHDNFSRPDFSWPYDNRSLGLRAWEGGSEMGQ